MTRSIFILLVVQFLIHSHMSMAQDDQVPVPSNIVAIQYDESSGISQVIRVNIDTKVAEVLLELPPESSMIARDSLSQNEVEAVETVLEDHKEEVLNRNLGQRLNRSWLINSNNVMLEIEYFVCGGVPQRVCFGYTEYGVLSDGGNYQSLATIDYHGEIHREGDCSYQEILTAHRVSIYRESRSISIGVAPQFPCNTSLADVYTLILQEDSSGKISSYSVPEAIGLAIGKDNIAYYHLSCGNADCSISLTVANQNQESIFASEGYSIPLSQALLLDLTWFDETTIFYQQYTAEPQPSFNFYTLDTVTTESELKFADYTSWQAIYNLSDNLVGFSSTAQSIIASEPFMFVSKSVSQVLDSGPNYLVYTEEEDCIDRFTVLDAELSTSDFEMQELLGTSFCVLDITFLDE